MVGAEGRVSWKEGWGTRGRELDRWVWALKLKLWGGGAVFEDDKVWGDPGSR